MSKVPRTLHAVPIQVTLYLAASLYAACKPDENVPISEIADSGIAESGADVPDAAADPSDGGSSCQTPLSEDLYPKFKFADPPAGPPSGGPEGDGGGPIDEDGGGLSDGDGGGLPEPEGDGGGPNVGDGGQGDIVVTPAPPNRFPNPYGRNQDLLLPGLRSRSIDSATFGTNGRHCETCHAIDSEWTINPKTMKERFYAGRAHRSDAASFPTNQSATKNDDLEPIFRLVDGANSPTADVSTPEARERAYSMLLSKALIRVGLPVPADADFELIAVDDPYNFASEKELSLFRRGQQMANLRFLTTLMWDGRETIPCDTLTNSLIQQARGAIKGHAQGPEPSPNDLVTIVQTELGGYTSQAIDNVAGPLNADGAHGGPTFLAQVPFYLGINAFDKADPRGQSFTTEVFTLYKAWRTLPGDSERNKARAQIAEGERIFNELEFSVRGVSGFNDELGHEEIKATCGACHNTPNVGTSSEGRMMDIGVSSAAERTGDLPLYTFRKKASGTLTKTSDPGQALISKKWAHMNRMKVPILRGLAGRAPYMHNGSAASLEDAVAYHEKRFGIDLTSKERAALVAFLSAL